MRRTPRDRPVRRHAAVLRLPTVLLLVGSVALGCGEGDAEVDDPAGATPSSPGADSPAPSAPSPPTDPQDPADPADPDKSSGSVTATGTIASGVEPGCVLLAGTPYLLLPGTGGSGLGELEDGAEVEVTGVADPGLVTTCQQGTPLEVTSVEPVAD